MMLGLKSKIESFVLKIIVDLWTTLGARCRDRPCSQKSVYNL